MSRFETEIAFNLAAINFKLAMIAAMPYPQRQDRCPFAGVGASRRTLASDATMLARSSPLQHLPTSFATAGETRIGRRARLHFSRTALMARR
jgi:hypothetical protein